MVKRASKQQQQTDDIPEFDVPVEMSCGLTVHVRYDASVRKEITRLRGHLDMSRGNAGVQTVSKRNKDVIRLFKNKVGIDLARKSRLPTPMHERILDGLIAVVQTAYAERRQASVLEATMVALCRDIYAPDRDNKIIRATAQLQPDIVEHHTQAAIDEQLEKYFDQPDMLDMENAWYWMPEDDIPPIIVDPNNKTERRVALLQAVLELDFDFKDAIMDIMVEMGDPVFDGTFAEGDERPRDEDGFHPNTLDDALAGHLLADGDDADAG